VKQDPCGTTVTRTSSTKKTHDPTDHHLTFLRMNSLLYNNLLDDLSINITTTTIEIESIHNRDGLGGRRRGRANGLAVGFALAFELKLDWCRSGRR
jgi:hypothetical protein